MRSLRCVPPALLAVAAVAGAAAGGEKPRADRLGDPLPAGAVARLGSGRLRADGAVQCLAFTPDGKALISGGFSRHLTFWDTATGRELRRLDVAAPQVYSLQLTADGKTLALGGGDGVVRILDADTGRERKALVDPVRRFGGNVYALLSPDGKSLIASAPWGRELVLWDVEGARVRQRYAGFEGYYNFVPAAFTPDGKRLVIPWKDRKLHVLDAETGKDLRALEGSALPGPTYSRTQALAVSPDGKRVALPDATGRSLLLLDLASGKVAKRVDKPTTGGYYYGGTRALAFTPNGRFVFELGGSGAAVQVWGVASGKLLRHLQAGTGYSSNPILAVSRDGKRVATATGSVIHLWDVPGGKSLHEAGGHQNPVTRVAFLRGGKLVSAGNSHLRAWDVAGMKQVASVELSRAGYGVQYLGTSRDGKGVRWLASNRSLYEWKPGAEREPRQLTSPRTTPYFPQSALSPDGRTMAVLDNAGKFFLVDLLKDRKERELSAKLENRFGGPVIVFSPDGRRVALGTPDRVVRVWDVATGTELRGLRPEGAAPGFFGTPRLEFSADGRTLLKLESDGSLRGYEVAGGGERFRLPRAPVPGYTQHFCWSPDGRLVAQAGGDGVVTIHDALTGKELARRDGKQGGVQCLAFSADGKELATGGTNTTVLVWEVPTPPPAGKGKLDADGAWAGLAEADAGKAFRTVAALAASPDEAVKLIKARLKPPAPADAKKIEKLIADLDNEDFEVRQKATEELAALGTEAEDALRKASTSPSPEVRNRVKRLLGKLSAGGVPVTRLRTVRAVEALERIGTPAVREALKGMLKAKTEGAIEQEVRGALARLGEK
jgi:WD40 repeat protein